MKFTLKDALIVIAIFILALLPYFAGKVLPVLELLIPVGYLVAIALWLWRITRKEMVLDE